jgi:hypothetical protein
MEFLIYDRQYLLKDIASGQFDKYLVPFAQSLAHDGKSFSIQKNTIWHTSKCILLNSVHAMHK